MEQSDGIAYSVILCTHNHADRLKATLAGLKCLKHPASRWELLIIDNGCTDDTGTVLNHGDWKPENTPVRIIYEPELGLSSARNRGIRESAGEYVIFIDDDETPDANWLTEYDNAVRIWHPDAVGGRIEVQFEQGSQPPWIQNDVLGFLGQLSHGADSKWITDPKSPIYGGNFGFRKSVFETIGYFNTDLGRKGSDNTGGEDTEIYRRMIAAGLKVRWVPAAVIFHRIQPGKLRKSYFLDLHFRQGYMEGRRTRGSQSRVPPLYLIPQCWRALKSAMYDRLKKGADFSLRKEMNVAYFYGYIIGWIKR